MVNIEIEKEQLELIIASINTRIDTCKKIKADMDVWNPCEVHFFYEQLDIEINRLEHVLKTLYPHR